GQGGDQDAGDDRPRPAELGGEEEGEQLRLVADFGERDDGGGDEEGVHGGREKEEGTRHGAGVVRAASCRGAAFYRPLRSIAIRYTSGTANRVSTVENPSPQTMLAATGPHISDFPPSPIASDSSPPMVVVEVIRIGTRRRRAA